MKVILMDPDKTLLTAKFPHFPALKKQVQYGKIIV